MLTVEESAVLAKVQIFVALQRKTVRPRESAGERCLRNIRAPSTFFVGLADTFYLLAICQGQPAFNAGQVALPLATATATHAVRHASEDFRNGRFPRGR
ncbi:hypothetical protein ACQUJS_07240 [Ralstonia pseudosolanacearum]